MLSTQTQLQASIDRTQNFIALWGFCGLSAVAFAIKPKMFSLDAGVFKKFALFHLFNKNSLEHS